MERLRSRIHFVIIDEAHHAMATTYRKLWKMFPEARFLGVTATPWRMNHSGFRRIFDKLILTQSVKKFISQGYLAPYNYFSLKPNSWVQRAINGIHKFDKWGDYDEHALIDTMDLGHIRAQLVKSYQKHAWKKKGIIYSINKQHSANICNDYRRLGVRIIDIDDSTPPALRKQYVDEFKKGEIDIIVNVNIFSEGFDCPDIEFIQLARPTRSLTMYLQQVGRGLRITEGKSKCIILDNVGMYSRFGLPDANRHWMAHFRGQDVDESPKRGKGYGWDNGYYDEPDLSEGDEEMLLVQETEAGIEPDDSDFIEPVNNDVEPPKQEVIPERIIPKQTQPQEPSRKLKTIPPMRPIVLLESNHFHDGYSIVADNSFYYIKVQASGNCYFIAPLLRKPSDTDELIVELKGDTFSIKHLIPEAEKAKEQIIGSILIENNIVTFSKNYNGKIVSTSFMVH